jgi:fibronectin-binding autotransporter adhesin
MCKRLIRLIRLIPLIPLVLATAAPAAAQVTGPPFVYTAGTVIDPDEMNTNFSTIYDNALNRFAGVMAGNLTWLPDATYDVGASGGSRMRDLFVGRDAAIVRNATVGGTFGVTGLSTLASLSVTGNATVGGTLGVTGAGTFTSTLAINSTSASALDVAGGIQAGSGNVNVIGTDGRIPAISSTYFASVSGANLTGIPESAINDDALLARVAANETITGVWSWTHAAPQMTFDNATSNWLQWPAIGTAAPAFTTRSVGTRLVLYPNIGASASDFAFGIESGALWSSVPTSASVFKWYGGTTLVATLSGAGDFSPVNQVLGATGLGVSVPVYSFAGDTNTGLAYTGGDAFAVIVGGTSIASYTTLGTTIITSPNFTGAISPAALASGSTNNYNPAGLSTTYTLRLGADVANSTLTGLVAQTGGAMRQICNLGSGSLTLANEDGGSTAANRFVGSITLAAPGSGRSCTTVWYDTTSSRWRLN